MYRDVVVHLSYCSNSLKRKGVAPKAELCPITANRPLELVQMDFLSLEPSKDNTENVLVIADMLRHSPVGLRQPKPQLKSCGKISCHYGFPEEFISDQGRNFECDLIKDLCRIANVDKIRTTPYHSMTMASVRGLTKTPLNMWGTLSTKDKIDWNSLIAPLTPCI